MSKIQMRKGQHNTQSFSETIHIVHIILKRVFGLLNRETKYNLKVIFANGNVWKDVKGKDAITVVFKKRRAEINSVVFTDMGFVESYFKGDIDFLGTDALRKVVLMGFNVSGGKNALFNPITKVQQLLYEAKVNNKNYVQAKKNAYYHYNLPAEFFRFFLGKTYGYTEGYYENGKETCDEAQIKKFEYICRKLRLKKGEKLVEVGAGWGYMSILAAEKYGVQVTNYGLVAEQNRIMQKMIDDKKLKNTVKIVVKDHRELKNEPNTYDKYVSIGVYEHAGKDCAPQWIESIAVALKKGGIGVISCMAIMNAQISSYIVTKHIFPGGCIPSLPQMLHVMKKYGLHVVDIESLRHHYQQACEDWYINFVTHWEEIKKINPDIFNEYFRRKWSLWLLGSIESFRQEKESLDVFHIVFTKGRNKDVYPLTRNFLYTK